MTISSPGPVNNAPAAQGSGVRITVLPFDDQRSDRTHLGKRSHLWGGESYFDLPSGSLSDAAAQSLAEYLTRQGWPASLSRSGNQDGSAISISGTILDLSVDADSRLMRTNLSAKNSMRIQIVNRGDESVVRERVSGTGTDQVFWFEAEDAQQLVNELFEKNFQKLLGDLRLEDQSFRLK